MLKTEFRRWYAAAAVTRVKLTLTPYRVTRSVSNTVTTVTSREVTILRVQLSGSLRWSTAEAGATDERYIALYLAPAGLDHVICCHDAASNLQLQLLALVRCAALAVKRSEDHVQPMPVMHECKMYTFISRVYSFPRKKKILRTSRGISLNSATHCGEPLLWRVVDWNKQQTMLLKISTIVSVNVTPRAFVHTSDNKSNQLP